MREGAGDAKPRVVVDELTELGAIERQLRRARVVEEADLAREALVAERAQHRHHGGDPAPAADKQHPPGARLGQHERALGLSQADDQPRPRLVAQEARHLALRMGRDGQLERAACSVLRAGGGVGASLTNPIDIDAQADELPRAQPTPILVRAEGESDALWRLVADRRDLGAHVALYEHRAHELDVTIDPVGVGKRLEQLRTQQAAAQAAVRGGNGQNSTPQSTSVYDCAQNKLSQPAVKLNCANLVTLRTCTAVLPI